MERQIQEIGYVKRGLQYAHDVVDGKVPACEAVRLACQRQLDDLQRAAIGDANFPYRFDVLKAEDPCWFIEQLRHIKGPKAGTPFLLEPWQLLWTTIAFGWLYKESGFRRFSETYFEFPKGNGKSPWSAGIALFMLCADGEQGAEVYSAAPTRDQAKYVFEPAQKMAKRCPDLKEEFGVEVNAHDIRAGDTSWFRTFSSEKNTTEGCNPHFVVIDELHAHPDRNLYDNIKSSMGKRNQDMLWVITTAGDDTTGICYERHEYLMDVLHGQLKNDNFLGVIYAIDPDDDWTTEAAVRKANPNFGVSVQPTKLLEALEEAKQKAGGQPGFKMKRLNIWCQADKAWINPQLLFKCIDKSLREKDFVDDPCVIGIDWAAQIDLAAIVRIYWRMLPGTVNGKEVLKPHWYVFGDYWTPKIQFQEGMPNAGRYREWEAEGWLHKVPEEEIDDRIAEDFLLTQFDRLNKLKEVAHDKWGLKRVRHELERQGKTMIMVEQLAMYLSDPMKEVEAAIGSSRFHFDGNPVLAWGLGNVVCHLDKNGNYFPNQVGGPGSPKKKDPASALFTGLNRALSLNILGATRDVCTEVLVYEFDEDGDLIED